MTKQDTRDAIDVIIDHVDAYILDAFLNKLPAAQQTALNNKGIDIGTLGEVWYEMKEVIEQHGFLPKNGEVQLNTGECICKYVDFLRELVTCITDEIISTIKTCFDKKMP